MQVESRKITCPKCGNQFNVEDAFIHDIEERMKLGMQKEKEEVEQERKELEDEKSEFLNEINEERGKLKEREETINKLKSEQDEIVNQKVKEEKLKIKDELAKEYSEEYHDKLKNLENEVEERKKENIELKNKEIELERLKRKYDERDKELELKYEKKLNQSIKESEGQMKLSLKREKEEYLEEINEEKEKLKEKEKNIKILKDKQDEIVEKQVNVEKEKLEEVISKKYAEDFGRKFKDLEGELEERKRENKKLKEKEIEFERLKRKYDERDKELELEYEKKFNQNVKNVENQIVRREQEKIELTMKEKDQKLEILKKQIKEMERKAEQGSMQLQGEVQELAIEEILTGMFKFDEIKEVPKGKKGADALQVVKDRSHNNCGIIIYESKRTKSFSNTWITKLKKDQLEAKADIAVLVSEALPEDINRIGIIDGIWISDFLSFKGLALVLRDSLLKVHQVSETQKNKGDKMSMLYNYLTSSEFKLQVEAIINGFIDLKDSITKEKVAMEKLWKEREKQIENVLINTTHFYGAIKGIAGKEIPSVPILELPGNKT